MGMHGGGHNHDDADGKPEKVDKRLIGNLLSEAAPYWYLFLIALVLIVALNGAVTWRPKIISDIIDNIMTPFKEGLIGKEAAFSAIQKAGIIFMLLVVSELVLGYGRQLLLNYTGKMIIRNMRAKIFAHIQKLPLQYFDRTPVGVMVTRVANDPEALNDLFVNVIVGLFDNIIRMAWLLVMMFAADIRMTFISIAVMPLIIIATYFFRKVMRKVFREIRTRLAVINATLSENLSGMRIIQAFNMQYRKMKEFEKVNKDYYDSNLRMVVIFGIFRPMMDVVKYLALTILLWYGGLRNIDGMLSVGLIYLFTTYISQFFHPIMELADKFNIMQSSLAAAEKIYALTDQDTEPEPKEPQTLNNVIGEIEFKNVWFAYIEDTWVLKDISFKIKPGEKVAFVGHTGAGKTSIINLICGFYEIQKGQILIDGIDIKTMRKEDYRSHIGLVLQDVFLMTGDIEGNIRLNNPAVSEKRVVDVSKFLGADEFIVKMEDGYKHKINQGGGTLSGGERQLVSFARALVNDPEILIMDEATSSIDTQTESILQNSLEKMMEGRTTIAIAHRLSTIKKADRIILIHNGELREEGSHNELMDKEGLYYDLYQLQFGNGNVEAI